MVPPRQRPPLVLAGWTGLVLLFLILPVVIVVPMSVSSSQYLQFPPPGLSLQWYRGYFTSEAWLSATITSLKVGVLTVLIATPLGTLASFGLVRGRIPGKRVLNGVILAPMIIPTIVVAVATYFAFSRVQLIGHTIGLAFAHTALGVPLVVINVSAALISFDEVLEQASLNLGANRLQTFWYVTFPLVRSSIFAGALFAFLTSFDELLVAMFIAGVSAQTLPIRMWAGLQQNVEPTIAAISTILIAISCMVLLGGEALRSWSGRRWGAADYGARHEEEGA